MSIIKSLILDIIVLIAFTIIPIAALMCNDYWLFILSTVSTLIFAAIFRKELVKAFAENNKELFQLFYPFKFREGQLVKVRKTAGCYDRFPYKDKEKLVGMKARVSKRVIKACNGKLMECYLLSFLKTDFKYSMWYEIDLYDLDYHTLWSYKELSKIALNERWE